MQSRIMITQGKHVRNPFKIIERGGESFIRVPKLTNQTFSLKYSEPIQTSMHPSLNLNPSKLLKINMQK